MKTDSIKKSLNEDVVLFVLPSQKQLDYLGKIISLSLKKKSKLCLVSLNRSYSDILSKLKKKKISSDKVFFIDCSSQKKEKANVFHVTSPGALTDINLMTKKALNAGAENVIFDSLSTLLAYGNHPVVLKYIYDLITFVRDNKKKIFFTLAEGDQDEKIMGKINLLFDKITVIGSKTSLAKTDAMKLMKELFGPQASKLVESSAKEQNPNVLLKKFETILSRLVGPENAKKQIAEISQKYIQKK